MKYYKHIFLQVIFCTYVSAQTSLQLQAEKAEFIESYKKVWTLLVKTENYTFNLRYLSFDDHHSKRPIESASGFYLKNGSNYRSNILGIKTIQNKSIKMNIDSVEKLIVLSNPDNINFVGVDTEQLEELVGDAKKVTKRKEGNSSAFRIDFMPNSLYDSYELRVSEKGLPEQMTFYYSTITDKDYDESIQGKEIKLDPRLEIYFDDFKELNKVRESDFSEKSYVVLTDNSVKKTERYKNYTIRDYRIKK